MIGRGKHRRGSVRHCCAGLCMAWQRTARQGFVYQIAARRGDVGLCQARPGSAARVMACKGAAWRCKARIRFVDLWRGEAMRCRAMLRRVGSGVAWHRKAWIRLSFCGLAWMGPAWPVLVPRGPAARGRDSFVGLRRDVGAARHGLEGPGGVRRGGAWSGIARQGLVCLFPARHCEASQGNARHGLAWPGLAMRGTARSCKAGRV